MTLRITYPNAMSLLLAGIVFTVLSIDEVRSTDVNLQDYVVCKNHYAASRIRETRVEARWIFCPFYCGRHYWCRAVTINEKNGGYECQFHDEMFNVNCNSFPVLQDVRLMLKKEVYVRSLMNGCYNGDTSGGPNCVCTFGFAGIQCERYIRDCKEGEDGVTGMIPAIIQPYGSNLAFEMLCNFNNGQTVALFRNDLAYNTAFNKSWDEYKFSFGVAKKNYWMGLEGMYQVLQQPGTTFKLQVWCFNRASTVQFSVFYSSFNIGSESSLYAKAVSTFLGTSGRDGLGGNAVPFCTYDKPCAGYPDNINGGWWYGDPSKAAYALTNPQGNIYWLNNNADFHTDWMTMALERTAG